MVYDLTDAQTYDVNGTKYRVGKDEHGYVQIQSGEMRYDEASDEERFVPYEGGSPVPPHIMLDRETARAVADYVAELSR